MRGGVVISKRAWTKLVIAGASMCVLVAAGCFGADKPVQIVAKPATGYVAPAARAASVAQRLLSDARDGRLDDFTFLSAAVVASGAHSSDEIKQWLETYEPVRSGILAKLPAGTASERLRAIHAGAHQFILTGAYQEQCSDLRNTFASGDFNCLSSVAVCFDLCQAAGLKVQPLLTRGHISLVYPSANGPVQAFEPGTAEWNVRQLSNEAVGRTLTAIELLGKFYYNRGVQQLHSCRYAEGISLLRTSLVLDPADGDARMNLAAGLNNWAVEHCREKRFKDAAALIEQGLFLDPHFAPLVANEQLVRGKLGK